MILLNAQASVGPSACNGRSAERDGGVMSLSRNVHDDKVYSSTSEILALWRLLGEGYRLSCMYKCQVRSHVHKRN